MLMIEVSFATTKEIPASPFHLILTNLIQTQYFPDKLIVIQMNKVGYEDIVSWPVIRTTHPCRYPLGQ